MTDNEGDWKDPTRLAIAQVTARLSDFRDGSEGLSLPTWLEGVDGGNPNTTMSLSLGLMNLSLILVGRTARAEGTTAERVLQSIAQFVA